jgi:hypothetical protein
MRGSFAVGLIAARFLKSSTETRSSRDYSAQRTREYASRPDLIEPTRGAY